MGPELGRYMAAQIGTLILLAFIIGGIVAVGGWWLIGFLIDHVTIGWQ